MITYRKGDATRFETNIVVAHICNNVGVWGGGFVIAVTRKLGPVPERIFRTAPEATQLGHLQLVALRDREDNFWVANMIAQNGVSYPGDKIEYAALDKCLKELAEFCYKEGCSVQMPRIGCGLAGSSWDKILPYIEKHFTKVHVTVFDL